MLRKIIATSTLLLICSSISFADLKVKDWSYSSNDFNNICIAETAKSVGNVQYKLQVSISKDSTKVSSIAVIVEGGETNDLKVISGKTNNSRNELTNFLALKKDLDSQMLVAQLWKNDTLIGDLMADSRFEVELITANENEVISEIDFSLRGSSKVLKGMAKDCLQIDSFSRPYELSQLLTSQENQYVKAITDKYSEQINIPNVDTDLDTFLDLSEELVESVKAGYIQHQELVVVEASHADSSDLVAQLTSELTQTTALLRSLNAEKGDRIRSNRSLEREMISLERTIEDDQAALPELKATYNRAYRQYSVAKTNTAEVSRHMDDLNQDVQFFDEKLNAAEIKMNRSNRQLEDTKINLDNAVSELRRANRNSNINQLERDLEVSQRERRRIKNRLEDLGTLEQRLRSNSELQEKRNRLSDVSSKKNALEDDMRNVRANIRSFKQKQDQLASAISSDKQKLSGLDSEISRLKQKKTVNETVIKGADASRKANHAKMKEVLRQYRAECSGGHTDANKARCEGLLAKKHSYDEIINGASKNANNLRKQNNEIDAKIASNRQLKSSLPQVIADKQAKINNLNSQISELKAGQQESKRKMDRLAQREQTLTADVRSIKRRVKADYNSERDNLQWRLGEARDEVRSIKNQIDTISSQLNRLEARVSNLRSDKIELEDVISDLSSEIANLSDDLAAAERKRGIFANSSEYKNAERDLERARRNLADAEQPYKTVNTRLTTNESRVKDVIANINFNEDRIASIPSEIEDNEVKLSDIEAELPTAKSENAKLEEELLKIEEVVTKSLEIIYVNETTLIDLI